MKTSKMSQETINRLSWMDLSRGRMIKTVLVGALSIGVFVYMFQYILGLLVAALMLFCGASLKIYLNALNETVDDIKSREAVIRRVPVVDSSETASIHSDASAGSTVGRDWRLYKPPRPKLDMRLSGSAIIDETLHEMVDYIMRDYVHSWYDQLSDDDDFIHELRKALQTTLVNLSSRVKEIDWIPYLTTQLVDEAASHLRLYRTALAKTKENLNSDLISVFFDVEAAMEKNLCRDMVCTDDAHLEDYLQGITQSLSYLLLPPEIYSCTPVGALAQDLLVHYVLMPLVDQLSDPDYVNQYIIWLCHSFPATPDVLITVIRSCDSIDEIVAVQSYFNEQLEEMTRNLKKTSSEEQSVIKAHIKSLKSVINLLEQRLHQLREGTSSNWTDEDTEQWQNYYLNLGFKMHALSVRDILKNTISMSYFLDYMQQIHASHYIHMYLNMDAWKASADQQLHSSDPRFKGIKDQEDNKTMHECLKQAAMNIYDQFLSEKSSTRIKLPEKVVHRFYIQARTESETSVTLFDEIEESLIDLLENTDKFYPSFKRHKLYVKCLMDMDFLKTETIDPNASDDEDEEEGEDVDAVSFDELEELGGTAAKVTWDYDKPTNYDAELCRDCLRQIKVKELSLSSADAEILVKSLLLKKYALNAEIIEAALGSEKGKQFGIYAVEVTRTDNHDKKQRKWHIYRRYSDFYDFHQWIKSKWAMVSRVEFPSKHTLRSTDRKFLEQRMNALNKYLASLLSMTSEPCYGEALQDSLLHFLEPGNYVMKKKMFIEKIDTLVNPLKQSVQNVTNVVKSVPDTFINTMDGFTKIFQSKSASNNFIEAHKVGASIEESDDNIPLRIILLMMDEVFDLKSRNQWLRRRLVAVIRQILKAMFGDTINRRIVDYVAYLTSPVRVTGYLQSLQKSLWPNGQKMAAGPVRDPETKLRARFAAKLSLLSSVSDEMKHLIGSDTTRRGLLSAFDMCQNRTLNRRFVLVLFEGILRTLFPDKPFNSTIQRLHHRSNRVGRNRPFLISSALGTPTPSSRGSNGSFNLGNKLSVPPAPANPTLVSPPTSRRRK